MALTQDDFVSAIAKLNELTRLGVLNWRPCEPIVRKRDAGLSVARSAFEATHEGRRLRITEILTTAAWGVTHATYVLDVRDEDGNVVFEFPDVAGLSDLFRSIKTQKVDIEGFIKKLVAG